MSRKRVFERSRTEAYRTRQQEQARDSREAAEALERVERDMAATRERADDRQAQGRGLRDPRLVVDETLFGLQSYDYSTLEQRARLQQSQNLEEMQRQLNQAHAAVLRNQSQLDTRMPAVFRFDEAEMRRYRSEWESARRIREAEEEERARRESLTLMGCRITPDRYVRDDTVYIMPQVIPYQSTPSIGASWAEFREESITPARIEQVEIRGALNRWGGGNAREHVSNTIQQVRAETRPDVNFDVHVSPRTFADLQRDLSAREFNRYVRDAYGGERMVRTPPEKEKPFVMQKEGKAFEDGLDQALAQFSRSG